MHSFQLPMSQFEKIYGFIMKTALAMTMVQGAVISASGATLVAEQGRYLFGEITVTGLTNGFNILAVEIPKSEYLFATKFFATLFDRKGNLIASAGMVSMGNAWEAVFRSGDNAYATFSGVPTVLGDFSFLSGEDPGGSVRIDVEPGIPGAILLPPAAYVIAGNQWAEFVFGWKPPEPVNLVNFQIVPESSMLFVVGGLGMLVGQRKRTRHF